MSQSDFNIGNQSGSGYRTSVNAALQALASQSVGLSSPATVYPNQIWFDSTTNLIKRRDNANTSWLVVGTMKTNLLTSLTGTYTVTISDYSTIFLCNGTFSVNFPAPSTLGANWTCRIKNTGTGSITLAPASGTIDGASSKVMTVQYQEITVCTDGTNFFLLGSELLLNNAGTSGQLLAGNGVNSLPTFKNPDVSFQWITVSGTNTKTATASPSIAAYANGQVFRFYNGAVNTGNVTLDIDTKGAIPVRKNASDGLIYGELPAGYMIEVIYYNEVFFASVMTIPFLSNGVLAMRAPLDMNTQKILHLVNGTDGSDAVNYGQITAIAQQEFSTNYTFVLTDAGRSVVHMVTDNAQRTVTIPSNAAVPFPIGTTLMIVNLKNVVNIAITTDTMYLAGTTTTGSRTLLENGVATAVKVSSTLWLISGAGLK